MRIIRSNKTVQGDLTINDGDVIVDNKDKGLVIKNQASDEKRVTAVTDDGVDTLQIKDV